MELYEHIKMPPPPQPPPPEQPNPDLFSCLGRTYSDNYPYSPQDSRLWIELFIIASGIDNELAGRLQYVRTVGAWLVLDATWGFKIQPVIDHQGKIGWQSPEQYEQEGRCALSPYGRQVMECLKELRHRFDKNMIR